MNKKSIADLKKNDLSGKRVLVRVDFNVPMDDKGDITDDTRIKAAIPTIKYLVDNGARVILVSHLGRPSGPSPELKMDPIAVRLSELIKKPVTKLDDCIGQDVETAVSKMQNSEIVMLENVRFYKEEEKNDEVFAKKLSEIADIYVNDAFGTAHRAHASTAGVAAYLPGYAGFLMEKELNVLGKILTNPERPFFAIIGGAKVSTKIGVIKNLLSKVDSLAIQGGMVFTFIKAQGYEIGKSLFDEKGMEKAEVALAQIKASNVQTIMLKDVVVADQMSQDANIKVVDIDKIPADMIGVDAGPKTIEELKKVIKSAKTIFWNGPVGVFEIDKFAKGTREVAKALADSRAITVIGGGDSVAAVEEAGLADKMTHISTGGGASLEFIEGKELPGVAVLQNK